MSRIVEYPAPAVLERQRVEPPAAQPGRSFHGVLAGVVAGIAIWAIVLGLLVR